MTLSRHIRIRAFVLLMCAPCVLLSSIARCSGAPWRDASNRATISNDSLELTVQAGMPCRLKDLSNGRVLLSVDPTDLPSRLPLYGSSTIDLDACQITQTATAQTVHTSVTASDGSTWSLDWRIEPGKGDLVLDSSVKSSKPLDEMRLVFFGADITEHQVVWVDGMGIARTAKGPCRDTIAMGSPMKDGAGDRVVQPLVAMFQGTDSGWFIEGREPRIGPALIMLQGTGNAVQIGMVRRFPVPTTTPQMYEIRIRPYAGNWADAVDPYVDWLEKEAGLLPLDKLPQSISWVKDISNQTYIRASDFDGLATYVKYLDPKRAFLGRMPIYRRYQIDFNYPDYKPNEMAAKWIRQAADMGFHVGPWFNTYCISESFPDLLERFKPGFHPIGKDAAGKEVYDGIRSYTVPLVYCSPAYKPWRDFLIDQMKDVIDCGADVVHLDQAQSPCGAFMVDSVDGIQGEMLLMKEIMDRYPGVAVETEQVNPMTAKYGKLCIIQMPLGHPLSGYIYHRFVKIAPDSYVSSPMDEECMDAIQSWGFMLPNAQPEQYESWVEICKAFQDCALVPDIRLPHREFTAFKSGAAGGGVVPVQDYETPDEGVKLFGYRGKDGLTAYFEKHKQKRGLVLYAPGKEPTWVGTTCFGGKEWSGPGYVKDWLVYDQAKMLCLDPRMNYRFDPKTSLPETGFHICAIPSDFALDFDDYVDSPILRGQRFTADRSVYTVRMTGHGQLGVYVPEGFLAFLDGRPVQPGPGTRKCTVELSADPGKPSVLLAFEQRDMELNGLWVNLPWQPPSNQRSWHLSRHVLLDNLIDGPSRFLKDGTGFFQHVSGTGFIVGRFPQSKRIRLQGAWGMRHEVVDLVGDGVIMVNGQEVLRMPGGHKPFPLQSFDVDATRFAGQYVVIEFMTAGKVHGDSAADWYTPQVIVER